MPTSTQSANTRRIPNPIYAAAGAGDLAYRRLSQLGRLLPGRALELGGRVAALRPVVVEAVREPARRVDVDKLRRIAVHNATVLQERAVTVYADLVKRGEKVVGGPYKELSPAGDVVTTHTPPPGDAPSAKTASAASASGPGTGKSPAKAVKKTRPTAVK